MVFFVGERKHLSSDMQGRAIYVVGDSAVLHYTEQNSSDFLWQLINRTQQL